MGMKRLIMLALAGIMAVTLVGCGEQAPKPEAKPDAAMESTDQAPAADVAPATDAAPATDVAPAPAEEAPADATTPTDGASQ